MSKTMAAAIATSFGRPLELSDIAIPTPGPGEVLVKVAACGVCHTDIDAVDGDCPFTFGDARRPQKDIRSFPICL